MVRIVAFGAALALTTHALPVLAEDGKFPDAVNYNAFCHEHFPDFRKWQACQDMTPKAGRSSGVASPGDKSSWGICENGARDVDGKLDQKRMAECLKQAMQPH